MDDNNWIIYLSISIFLFVIVVVLVVMYVYRRRQYKKLEERLIKSKGSSDEDHSQIFDHELIVKTQHEMKNKKMFDQQVKKDLSKKLFQTRFNRIKQIGKGGFSSVWEYYDNEKKENVAVKI